MQANIKYFIKYQDGTIDDSSCIAWWLLPAFDSDDDAIDYLCGQDPTFTPYSIYRGPGRSFENKPCIRRTATRTLVTQHCGMDI